MLKLLPATAVFLVSLVWLAPEASACPQGQCASLVTQIQLAPGEAESNPNSGPSLAADGDEASVRARDLRKLEPQAPEFWTQFRSYAYKQLPTHREENFTAVWVAMPISTSDGTVPTLGVRGLWW
jgi:hypothetical protein